MKEKLLVSARLIYGLMFFVFGLNGFFYFIPLPTPTPEAGAFVQALMATGFIFPMIKCIEILVGISLLTGRYTTLALVVITPILIVITSFHLFLDHSGLSNAIFMVFLHIFLTNGHWKYYKELFTKKAELR